MSQTAPFAESLLDSYTDDNLTVFISTSPSLITTRREAVLALSSHLVAKPVPSFIDYRDEIHAMERAESVGVSVPIVRRVVGAEDLNYLIMDRVEGETLEQSWSRLGLWKTVHIAWQLRSYLQALRTVTSQTSGGLSSGRVRSEWFQGIYMPVHRASPEQFTNYINWWLIKCRPSYCQSRLDLRLEPPPQYFLVHQDLAPRNMILDQSGKLWLLDWGRAGYYPEYMEYFGIEPTAMPWLLRPTWAAWWGRFRWSLLRWIAWFPRSSYQNTLQSLRVMRQRSNRFRLDKTPYSENE